jgi:YD repeat-containing protein
VYKNLESITDSVGNTTFLEYDNYYHVYLTCITNALNQSKTATYDFTTGNVTSLTDSRGYTTFYQYDALGRIIKKVNPDLKEKEAVYSDFSNTVIFYDELDHKTIHYHDGLSRVTKTQWYVTDTTFVEGLYTYNYMSKTNKRTDPGGHVYVFEYDSQGRLTKSINPDSTS